MALGGAKEGLGPFLRRQVYLRQKSELHGFWRFGQNEEDRSVILHMKPHSEDSCETFVMLVGYRQGAFYPLTNIPRGLFIV